MTITLIILALSAILFVSGKIRSDLVAICAALALVLTGVLTPEEALAGFSNPIVIMMTGLFVVGGGIFSTGLAKRMGTGILGLAGTSETKLFVLLMLTTSVVGAFVSNTGTVALMLPIVVSMARGAGVSPARMLMPLAFAGSMGGMLTLIGTPPNLIVRDALVAAGYAPLTFFSFTPIGILCIVVGTLALIPLSRKFLKERTGKNTSRSGKTLSQLAEEYKVGQGLMAAQITFGSPMMGKTLKQLNVYNAYGVNVIEIRRIAKQGAALRKVEQFALADVELQTDDVLYLSGSPERINLLIAENALLPQKQDEAAAGLNFYDVGMAEILILPTSALVGRTVAQADFRVTYGLNILGIRRHDDYLLDDIKNRRLHASDIILVQGPWDNIARLNKSDGTEWVVIGQPQEQAARVTLDYKAPLAALIMLLMVVAMAFDSIPCPRHSRHAGCCSHDIHRLFAQCRSSLQNHQLGKHHSFRCHAPHVYGTRKNRGIVLHFHRTGSCRGRLWSLCAVGRHLPGHLASHLFHFEHRDSRTHGSHCPFGRHGARGKCRPHAHGRNRSRQHVFCIAFLHTAQCPGDVGRWLQTH